MTEATATRPRLSWGGLGAWVALTYFGIAIGGDGHLQVFAPTTRFDPADLLLDAAVVGFVFGAIAGAIAASLQWIVLRTWAPGARGWIPLSAIGFGLAHAFNDALRYRPLEIPVVLLIGGLVIGGLQAFALRGVLRRPWVWIPVVVAGRLVGFSAAVYLLGRVTDPLAEFYIAYGAAGLAVGVVTGAALRWEIGGRSSP